MIRFLFAVSAVTAALAASAVAQPSMTEPSIAPTVSCYVGGGLTYGFLGVRDPSQALFMTPGALFEGGVNVARSPVWLRGAVAGGVLIDFFHLIGDTENASGSFLQVRGGVELRGCGQADRLCVVAGADFAFEPTWSAGVETNHAVIIPRFGIATASARWPTKRVRYVFEAVIGSDGSIDGGGVALSLASR